MKLTSNLRTERNYSQVLKISENKYMCLDSITGECYRICTNVNELVEVAPYEIDFKLDKVIYKIESSSEHLRTRLNAAEKKAADLQAQIETINKVLGYSSTYNHCVKLEDDAKKQAAKDFLNSEKIEAKLHCLSLLEYRNFRNIIASKNFETSHSMGCKIVVNLENKPFFTKNTCEEYRGRKKWSATHGNVSVNFTKKEAKRMQLIGGVISIIEKIIDKHITQYTVIEITGKFDISLTRRTMYVTNGYHGATVEECRAWRNSEAIILRAKRAGKEGIELKKELAKYKFVGLTHSTDAGNCAEGTKEFARQHGLNIKNGYNLAYLLSLEPTNQYILRML
jgi:hypothetical protein